MKQSIMIAALFSFAVMTPNVWAKSDAALVKEAKANVVTIAQAKKLKDETGVTLTGQIVRQLQVQSDEFELKDKTGSIVVEIDDDLWIPLSLKAGDKVRILGEVDTHRTKPTDIEAVHVERVK